MKKFGLILLAAVVVIGLWAIGMYNGLVTGKAGVDNAWANVEVQYNRRHDLVPQLVSTVEASANFEKKTLTEVVAARSKATSTSVDISNPDSLKAFTAAQGELSGALSRLLVSVEAYPELKSTEGFRDLQSQLEGNENRIAVARSDFNKAATVWNGRVATFPRLFFARMFGFGPVALFDAAAGSEVAPAVKFDIQ